MVEKSIHSTPVAVLVIQLPLGVAPPGTKDTMNPNATPGAAGPTWVSNEVYGQTGGIDCMM